MMAMVIPPLRAPTLSGETNPALRLLLELTTLLTALRFLLLLPVERLSTLSRL